MLDRQQWEKDEITVKGHTMTKKEKKINVDPLQAYKGSDTTHITALLPGYANSKYIHPYSPEAKYSHILQYKDVVVPAPKEGGRPMRLNKSGIDLKGKSETTSPTAVVTHGEGTSPTLPPEEHSSNQRRNLAALLSPQGSSQKWETRHNPITNPIPGNMQNPYLMSEFRKLHPVDSKSQSYLGGIGSRTLTNQS